MNGRKPDTAGEIARLETPGDVAVLYAWANLNGAAYRDFSASRREHRARVRHSAAQARWEAEMRARAEAEAAVAAIDQAAREAEGTARFHEERARRALERRQPAELEKEKSAWERALLHAEELSRRATQERMESARRVDAIRAAEQAVRREAREIAEAQASAERQSQRYAEGQRRRVAMAGPQPMPIRAGENAPPMEFSPAPVSAIDRPSAPAPGASSTASATEEMTPERFAQRRSARTMAPLARDVSDREQQKGEQSSVRGREQSEPEPWTPRSRPPYAPESSRSVVVSEESPEYIPYRPVYGQELASPDRAWRSGVAEPPPQSWQEAPGERLSHLRGILGRAVAAPPGPAVPAWIHQRPELDRPDPVQKHTVEHSPVSDTLQHSRERVASRWYALRGVFDPATPEMEPTQARTRDGSTPILAIFSLAGGVGKTSLTASVGRALSAMGERVLLADITPHGLLPFYFGASELRPGIVRNFSPPPGSADAPIALVTYDIAGRAAAETAEEALARDLTESSKGLERVIVDLSSAASWSMRRLAALNATVLVPIAPDMNSVITLGAIDRFFAGMVDAAGRPVQPRFLLAQFETSLPLHLDVREVLRQQLGERLLPFVIHRSPAVGEALAEGMTVIDYAPETAATADYRNLANWVRSLAPPAFAGARNARWSEQ